MKLHDMFDGDVQVRHVALAAAWLAGLAVVGMMLPLGVVIGMLGVSSAVSGALVYRHLTRGPKRTQQLPQWAVRENERTAAQLREMQRQLSTRPQALPGGQPRQLEVGRD